MNADFFIQHDALREADSRIWKISQSPVADSMHFYHRVLLSILGKISDDVLNAAIAKAQLRTEGEIEAKATLERDKETAGVA